MKSVLVAALVVRMTAAGGAGEGVEGHAQPTEAGNTWADVRKHFSTLRNELSTLQAEFHEAHERHRRDAERNKQALEQERLGRP